MLDIKLRIVLLLATILSVLIVVRSSRKGKIGVKDASNWFLISIFLILGALFPEIVVVITQLVGISVPSNAVYAGLIALLLGIVFYLNIKISRLSLQVKDLVQKISLREREK